MKNPQKGFPGFYRNNYPRPAALSIRYETVRRVDAALQHVARPRTRDLILLDSTGDTILGAYPFTEAVTGHT
jgi:hypothetical protein